MQPALIPVELQVSGVASETENTLIILVEVILPDLLVAEIVTVEVAKAVVVVPEMSPDIVFKFKPSGKTPELTEYVILFPEKGLTPAPTMSPIRKVFNLLE